MVYCSHFGLLVLFAEFTIEARVFIVRYMAVSPHLLPAGFGAANIERALHATGAVVHLPAGIKLEKMTYCRKVKPLVD